MTYASLVDVEERHATSCARYAAASSRSWAGTTWCVRLAINATKFGTARTHWTASTGMVIPVGRLYAVPRYFAKRAIRERTPGRAVISAGHCAPVISGHPARGAFALQLHSVGSLAFRGRQTRIQHRLLVQGANVADLVLKSCGARFLDMSQAGAEGRHRDEEGVKHP